ncbi:hypothetical protein BaRGS_00024339 [Batillaria attramentaria]|uniref:Uncharacterized protein n=1 Tax=Batillaria attramentaria TaxID=370345 RepID=A0ABD0KBJ7_9CAEN
MEDIDLLISLILHMSDPRDIAVSTHAFWRCALYYPYTALLVETGLTTVHFHRLKNLSILPLVCYVVTDGHVKSLSSLAMTGARDVRSPALWVKKMVKRSVRKCGQST